MAASYRGSTCFYSEKEEVSMMLWENSVLDESKSDKDTHREFKVVP